MGEKSIDLHGKTLQSFVAVEGLARSLRLRAERPPDEIVYLIRPDAGEGFRWLSDGVDEIREGDICVWKKSGRLTIHLHDAAIGNIAGHGEQGLDYILGYQRKIGEPDDDRPMSREIRVPFESPMDVKNFFGDAPWLVKAGGDGIFSIVIASKTGIYLLADDRYMGELDFIPYKSALYRFTDTDDIPFGKWSKT